MAWVTYETINGIEFQVDYTVGSDDEVEAGDVRINGALVDPDAIYFLSNGRFRSARDLINERIDFNSAELITSALASRIEDMQE